MPAFHHIRTTVITKTAITIAGVMGGSWFDGLLNQQPECLVNGNGWGVKQRNPKYPNRAMRAMLADDPSVVHVTLVRAIRGHCLSVTNGHNTFWRTPCAVSEG